MSLSQGLTSPLAPFARWLGRRLWWMEHAFERARASDKAVDDTRLRIFFVLALFGAGYLTLALGAGRAALFSPYGRGGEPVALAPNARADIVDRNGLLMAGDLPRYGLYVDPGEMVYPAEVRAALIEAEPDIVPAKLNKALSADRAAFVIGGLTPEQRDQIHDLALPGVSFQEEVGRGYPLGALASHVIGFTTRDGAGLAGAEKAFNDQIRADAGKPVALSIDLRVQGALEDELDQAASAMQAQGAAGIVVNVRTGEVIGLASWPAYDPNRPQGASQSMLTNRVAGAVFEPGSVMKVFTLAMGINSGVATPDTLFDVATPLVIGDQTIHDYEGGKSQLTLAKVFTHSSNIGAARLGLKAGPQVMSRYFHAFGLFDAAPSELLESTRPLTPRAMNENIVATMSFGHAISVSPLALATGMSAILNGGVYRPLTLRKLEAGQAPAPGRRVIRESTSRTMLDLMRLNVVEGTGAKADVPGFRVGGKTGTATKLVGGRYVEGRNAQNLASFAAIFPTDAAFADDRYLVLIMINSPKPTAADSGATTGAMVSATVAGRVIERIGPLLGVRRVILASDLAPKAASNSASLGANER